MATEYNKPTGIEKIWCTTGSKSPAPDDTKIAKGHEVEIPLKETFNYLQNKQDSMLAHINQHGIPQWDADSQYIANKSYVMGGNGTIYAANLDNKNVDPVTEVGSVNWRVAFSSTLSVYTKAESDAAFARRSSNLSDLASFASARTNLSVYSKAESDNNYLSRAANLSDLISSVNARNNLSVYSRAEADSRYLAIANNFTDVPDKPLAFERIKQLASSVFAGVTRFANNLEIFEATSTNTAVTPSGLGLGMNIYINEIGHFIFPSWARGFGIVWGRQSIAANSRVTVTKTWNTGLVRCVVASINPTVLGNSPNVSIGVNWFNSDIYLTNPSNQTISAAWIAIVANFS